MIVNVFALQTIRTWQHLPINDPLLWNLAKLFNRLTPFGFAIVGRSFFVRVIPRMSSWRISRVTVERAVSGNPLWSASRICASVNTRPAVPRDRLFKRKIPGTGQSARSFAQPKVALKFLYFVNRFRGPTTTIEVR
jgi:hypothetical protein